MKNSSKLFLTFIIILIILILAARTLKGGWKTMFGKSPQKNVYTSQLASIGWYSQYPNEVTNELEGYLSKVKTKKRDNVIALISPHAGYRYSGQTAAYGISQLKGKKYERVIILGPSHQMYLKNRASLPKATHYATPLGEVQIDTKFMAQLLKSPYFSDSENAHEGEHSVQIQLPFLQVALKKFSIVPIVIGQLDPQARAEIANTILNHIDDKTLVIASSDFVHYGSRFSYVPFRDNIPKNIEQVDMGAWSYINLKDSNGFSNYCVKTGATICGREPIAILLKMLPDNAGSHLLEYTTSGQLTGDWQNSVSYLSAAFTGEWSENKNINKEKTLNKKEKNVEILTNRDKHDLLVLARNTVEYYLANRSKPSTDQFNMKITSGMKEIMGAFVTLKMNGQLRGCIGEIMPRQALYKAVIDQAVNAAVNDHRFSPVQSSDVSSLEFEISALTAPRPVDSYSNIVLGKHGIILQKNGKSAVFLPQVAPEQGWTLEETLTHLSVKAGLSENDWKEGTQFLVFEAIVFHEEK
jgi:MEMO1 family protein